jgi:hypothetical protein
VDAGTVDRCDNRSRHAEAPHVDADRLWCDRADVPLEEIRDVIGILLRHQPHRHLRTGLARDHRFGALACESAKDAMDLQLGRVHSRSTVV